MYVTLTVPNGHSVLNGDVDLAQNGTSDSFERVQIINDEKQFTFVYVQSQLHARIAADTFTS